LVSVIFNFLACALFSAFSPVKTPAAQPRKREFQKNLSFSRFGTQIRLPAAPTGAAAAGLRMQDWGKSRPENLTKL
jgi:hypothetical protein